MPYVSPCLRSLCCSNHSGYITDGSDGISLTCCSFFSRHYDSNPQLQQQYLHVSKMPSSYDVLGLPSTACLADVKARYKELALKYHPDKNPGHQETAHRRFVRLNEAYNNLLDHFERRPELDQGPPADHLRPHNWSDSARPDSSKEPEDGEREESSTPNPNRPPPRSTPPSPPPKPHQPPPYSNHPLLQNWPTRHLFTSIPPAATLPRAPKTLPTRSNLNTLATQYTVQLSSLRTLASGLRTGVDPDFHTTYLSAAMAAGAQKIITWVKAEKRMVSALFDELEASCWWISPRDLSGLVEANIARRQAHWFADVILSKDVVDGLMAKELWLRAIIRTVQWIGKVAEHDEETFLTRCRQYFPHAIEKEE